MLKVLIFMGALCCFMHENHAAIKSEPEQKSESTQEIKVVRLYNEEWWAKNLASILSQPYHNYPIYHIDDSEPKDLEALKLECFEKALEALKFECFGKALDKEITSIRLVEIIKRRISQPFQELDYDLQDDLICRCVQLVKNIRGKTKEEQLGLILKLICSLCEEIGDKRG